MPPDLFEHYKKNKAKINRIKTLRKERGFQNQPENKYDSLGGENSDGDTNI